MNLTIEDWSFTGAFDDYEEDPVVSSFFKHILSGTLEFSSHFKKYEDIEKHVKLLCQHLRSAVRTDRQLRYVSSSDPDGSFRNSVETPLTVGLPLSLHFDLRSSEIVKNLSHMGLGISYPRLMKLEMNLANSVMKNIDDIGGYSLPTWAADS